MHCTIARYVFWCPYTAKNAITDLLIRAARLPRGFTATLRMCTWMCVCVCVTTCTHTHQCYFFSLCRKSAPADIIVIFSCSKLSVEACGTFMFESSLFISPPVHCGRCAFCDKRIYGQYAIYWCNYYHFRPLALQSVVVMVNILTIHHFWSTFVNVFL